jgi:hypothetical protein
VVAEIRVNPDAAAAKEAAAAKDAAAITDAADVGKKLIKYTSYLLHI